MLFGMARSGFSVGFWGFGVVSCSPFKLRRFESGVMVVQSGRHNDDEVSMTSD